MKIGKALLLFLRSNTHLALLAVYIALMVTAVLLTDGAVAPAALTVGYAVGAVLLFLSRRGAMEIVRERNEDTVREQGRRLEMAADLRERIARLRIADSDIGRSIEQFLLLSGQFLEACREKGRYVPQGVHEIELVLKSCDSYLKGLDEASTRRRYSSSADGSADGSTSAAADDYACTTEEIRNRTQNLIAASTECLRRLNREELHIGLALEELDTQKELEDT